MALISVRISPDEEDRSVFPWRIGLATNYQFGSVLQAQIGLVGQFGQARKCWDPYNANLLWIPREFWSPELPVPPRTSVPPPRTSIPDEKNFGRKKYVFKKNSDKKIPTKKFRTKKNWGQGTGARHGRCGGKARVINGDSWGAQPPRPPTTPFQKICPSGANFLK